MSIYYRDSGLTWKQYLQADSFVQDITGSVKQSGDTVVAAISTQTRQLVGSLESGFGQMEYGLEQVAAGIENLRAEFSYGMGLIVDQLQIQQQTLQGILDRLDAIHKTLESPLLTQARELCRLGMDRMQKGLLDKALEAFLESEKKNDTDCFVQFQLGTLYLYGRDEDDNVIDLPKAGEHFRLAARYANAEISSMPEAARLCGEAYLHAAIACYAQANERWIAGDTDVAQRFTEEAAELSKRATQVYPKLSEAFYHHAKCAALLGDGNTSTASLEVAILADRNYCLKADADRDFDGVRPELYRLYESLRERAKAEAAQALEASRKKLLEDWIFQSREAKKAETEIQNLLQQAEATFRSKDTYFDSLDALTLLQRAQQILADIPFTEELQTQAGYNGDVPVAFSPDGRYLVIAIGSYTIVYIWEVGGFQEIRKLSWRPTSFVPAVAFSPDGRYLTRGGEDTVRVWEIGSFRLIRELTGHTSSVLAFSFDGRYLASASGYTVYVWEMGSFQQIQALTGHTGVVHTVGFSLDGQYLVSASDDKTVRIFEVGSFREIQTLGHTDAVCAVGFSPDGRYLASVSGKTIYVWEMSSFRQIQTLTGHTNVVQAVAFAPDGKYLASGSADNTVCVWEVARFRQI
ncbi:WD40 repeat domain-containing protein [Candidatus Poribacteria bacterium]|nr:WD40 repeat domain-containing protein [Candidatus Poribacteria bacterium]